MTSTPGSASQAQMIAGLQRTGLSFLGIQQALQGNIVTNPSDRAAIAKILAAIGSLPPTKLEVYDYPGDYAQRFDGVDKGKPDTPPRPTPTIRKT